MSRLHPTLADRCRIHAEKMQNEGWYVTANVLAEAAEALDEVGEIRVNLPFDEPPSDPR